MRLLTRKILAIRRKHRHENPLETARRKNKYIRRNPHKWAKLYNSPEWRRLRKKFIAANPVCQLCRDWPSNQVDHIVRHEGDVEKFLDPSNLQALCRDCHSKKSAAERRGWRPER